MRFFILFSVFSISTILSACSSRHFTDDVQNFLPADIQATDFVLLDTEGRSRSLGEFQGNLVLLHFWATWCMSCYEEMYALKNLAQEFEGKPFAILALSIDDSPALVKKYVARHKVPFPVLLDVNKQVQSQYYASGIPSSVFVGKDGALLYLQAGDALAGPILSGVQDWGSEALRGAIRAELGEIH